MKNKKYYTISEVTKLLNIPASQLRYLEKSLSALKVIQVKGRRYYTSENIDLIKAKLGKTEPVKNIDIKPLELSASNDQMILKQINQLIDKFNNVLNSAEYIINSAA